MTATLSCLNISREDIIVVCSAACSAVCHHVMDSLYTVDSMHYRFLCNCCHAGDPIEMGAAAAVLLGSKFRAHQHPLTVSSDKSGVGHTEPAAGMSGVVHAVLSATQRMVLPVLHLHAMNPYMSGALSGNAASNTSIPKQSSGAVLQYSDSFVTGVSSFAFQGTNAHLLLLSGSSAAADAASAAASAGQQQSLLMQQRYLSVLNPAHSLVRSAMAAAGVSGTVQFEVYLGHPSVAWLFDHIVGGRAIVPGAAYLEMGLAAGRQLLGSNYATDLALASVSISAPLVLLDGPVAASAVHLSVTVNMATGALSISSNTSGRGSSHPTITITHVSGSLARPIISSAGSSLATLQLVRQAEHGGLDSSFDRIAAKGLEPLNSSVMYTGLAKAGLKYGPAFRLLRSVKSGASTAAAQLQAMSEPGEADAMHS